jgi:hypothetical protein
MMAKELKTITLGDGDSPSVSICNGHVNANTFAKALKAEGWSGDRISKNDLTYEYWIRLKRSWKRSEQADYKAQAVTVLVW